MGIIKLSGLIGDESFYSDTFTLDEQSFSVFEISRHGFIPKFGVVE